MGAGALRNWLADSKPHVVLVEDDDHFILPMRYALESRGAQVTVLTRGREALEFLANPEKDVDLILLDIGLPDVDGFQVLTQLQGAHGVTRWPVIMLTASGELRNVVEAFQHGAYDYLVKPVRMEEFTARIGSCLEKKRLRDELETSNRELVKARDAAEANARFKSEFLANMSHEVRTPMNGIIGLTDLVLEGSLERHQRENLEMIRGSMDVLLHLINDILDLSKIEAGRLALDPHDFDLRRIVENVGELMRPAAQDKGLTLISALAMDAPRMVRGDSIRLRQILLNFIGNAVKFTSEGSVTLWVRSVPGTYRFRFEVRDTGIGIAREKRDLLFESFVQADISTARRYGGTGLGLSISRSLVELMHGTIGLESEEGLGSLFFFEVDLAPATEPLEPKEKLGSLLHPCRAMLAVVPELKALLSHYLEGLGCQVLTAEDWHKGEGVGYFFVDSKHASIRPPDPACTVLWMETSANEKAVVENETVDGVISQPVKLGSLLEAMAHPSHQDPGSRLLNHPEAASNKAHSTEMSTHATPLRVLVADDNAINLKVAIRMLERLGYAYDLARHGREVIQKLRAEPFDVVLMDVQMPEMDGYEATQAIRQEQSSGGIRPNLPIIAMTANAMRGDRQKCLSAGMDDYLSKPVRLEELRKKLEAIASVSTIQQAVPSQGGPGEPAEEVNSLLEVPLDLERLRDFADDDEQEMASMMRLFVTQTDGQIQAMRQAWSNGQTAELKRLLISCKGASTVCGAVVLAKVLTDLESLLSDPDTTQVQYSLNVLADTLQDLRKYLDTQSFWKGK